MALVKIEYVGPLGSVTVPSLQATFETGKPVEVSEENAAGLLVQDIFREVKTSKTAKEA